MAKKKAKKKAKKVVADPKFQVWAYYSHPQGIAGDKDDEIRKAAGKEDFGSGFGMHGGLRDLSFFAQNMAHALRMKDRILKLRCVVRVEVSEDEKGGNTVFTKKNKKGKWQSYG